MAATKSYILSGPPGAMKAIPLNALPAEAWQGIRSGFAGEDDVSKAYEAVPWLKRGVDIRAEALANLPFAFAPAGSDKELDEGELPDVLDAVLSIEFDTLLNMVEAWLTLYGAAYIFKGTNVARRIRELRPLHPATIKPVFSETSGLEKFERILPGGRKLDLSPEELCYIWLPPRRSDIGPGLPPAKAALSAANLLKGADDFGAMYFDNGVIAPTLVTVPAGTPAEEKARLETWAKRAMGGLKKAFNVLGIAAEVQVNSLGEQIPLGSLALPELTDKKREDIATALGVPHSILFSNAANFATARQDDLHFYDKTVIPEARRIEQALNKQVFLPLGWRLIFKPERLEIYQALEAEKAAKLALLYDRDVLTREEVRDEMGRPAEPVVGKFKSDERRETAVLVAQARPFGVPAGVAPAMPMPDQTAKAVRTHELPDPATQELGRWERKALKRFDEGKPEKALEFESEYIPAYVKAWLLGALEQAESCDDVKAAFASAREWQAYP